MAELRMWSVVRSLIPRLLAAYLAVAFAATAAFAVAVAAYARPMVALYLALGAVVGLSLRRGLRVLAGHHVLERAAAALTSSVPR